MKFECLDSTHTQPKIHHPQQLLGGPQLGSVFEKLKAWFRGSKKEEEPVSQAEPEEPIEEYKEPAHAFMREEHIPYDEPGEPVAEPEEPVHAFVREEYTPYEAPEEPAAEPEEPIHALYEAGMPYEEPEEPATEPDEPAYSFMREEHMPFREPEEHVAEPKEPEKEPEEPDLTTFAKAAGFLKKREVEA